MIDLETVTPKELWDYVNAQSIDSQNLFDIVSDCVITKLTACKELFNSQVNYDYFHVLVSDVDAITSAMHMITDEGVGK